MASIRSEDKMLAKRKAILDCALRLFNERGFYGTAVPLIAEEAQVGTGTIYRYFSSKEDLVNELYRSWKAVFISYIADGLPQPDIRASFQQLWRSTVRFMRKHGEPFIFLEIHFHAPYLDAESRKAESDVFSLAAALAEQGKEAGVFKDISPEVMVHLVFGSLVTLAKQSHLGRLELSDTILQQAETCCWDAITRHS